MTTITIPSPTQPNHRKLIVGVATLVFAAVILMTAVLVYRAGTSSGSSRTPSTPAGHVAPQPQSTPFVGTANSTADNPSVGSRTSSGGHPSSAWPEDCAYRYLRAVC